MTSNGIIFKSKEDLVSAYRQHVVSKPDTREDGRELLRLPALNFLRSSKSCDGLSSLCYDVVEQNILHDSTWEPRKAINVCRHLEDIVLRLADTPWRKEFHCIKFFSGFYCTMVNKSLMDADRLLELAGYEMDLCGHQMSLRAAPMADRVMRAAAELFIFGLELQVEAEILCLVQAKGFKASAVLQCRKSMKGDNQAAADWIQAHHSHDTKPLPKPPDPVYSEIPSGQQIRAAKKTPPSTPNSAHLDHKPVHLSTADKQEPIYSVVNKARPPSDSSLYGFDPSHLHALRSHHQKPLEIKIESQTPSLPSLPEDMKSHTCLPVTFSTFRPPSDIPSSAPARNISPGSHYENIQRIAIDRSTMEPRRRPAQLSPIPVSLPSPPVPQTVSANHSKYQEETVNSNHAATSPNIPSFKSPPVNGYEAPYMIMVGNRWKCSSCNSFNLQGTEDCDICGKTQRISEPTSLQCSKCTSVNIRGSRLCVVCENPLSS